MAEPEEMAGSGLPEALGARLTKLDLAHVDI
jgi:hypothetical protein